MTTIAIEIRGRAITTERRKKGKKIKSNNLKIPIFLFDFLKKLYFVS